MSYEDAIKIPTLTEKDFQEFLQKNLKGIFVFETKDYEYCHYLPSHFSISGSAMASGQFARQA
jgi:hypothetical protein